MIFWWYMLNKELVRREFLKLRFKGHSYVACQRILKASFEYEASIRTLKRWSKRFEKGDWNLRDESRRPHVIHRKVSKTTENKVMELRQRTGWGAEKLYPYLKHLQISVITIHRILSKNNLCRQTKTKGKRVKWVRWQRAHPNSLWQIDHTDEQDQHNCYTLSIIDDFSRYSLALVKLTSVTTNNVTHILDQLIVRFGTPKQILTDNGSAYGGKSKNSRFDRWCRRRGIQHIRSRVHSPTTNGKVERVFKTLDDEMEYCNQDHEAFRMRYNHFRPHSSHKGQTPAQKYNEFANWF
jgi:transposase InsO family protein